MSIIIDKKIYPTLDLVLAQLYGARETAFAFYDIVDAKNFDNAFQITLSIVVRDIEVED